MKLLLLKSIEIFAGPLDNRGSDKPSSGISWETGGLVFLTAHKRSKKFTTHGTMSNIGILRFFTKISIFRAETEKKKDVHQIELRILIHLDLWASKDTVKEIQISPLINKTSQGHPFLAKRSQKPAPKYPMPTSAQQIETPPEIQSFLLYWQFSTFLMEPITKSTRKKERNSRLMTSNMLLSMQKEPISGSSPQIQGDPPTHPLDEVRTIESE